MGTIVVGVDGSNGSLAALRFAVEEAQVRHARLRVVTAWHVPPLAYSGGFAPVVDPHEFERSAKAVGAKALTRLGEEAAGIDVERVTTEGQAAHVLLEAAKDAAS